MTTEFTEFITQDPTVQSLLGTARQIAPYNSTVQITGESGSGKDVLAGYIHRHSQRRSKPLIKIDLSAIPQNLLESELFGHVKGAFSSAHQNRVGRLEAANGSTVYLDHVNELNPAVQARLTRVLQEQEFEPVGSNTTVAVDIRFIASSRQDLGNLVRTGKFREDLYFRLSVMPIHLPPLRKRPADIPLLAKFFLDKYAALHQKKCPKLESGVLDLLCSYHWPGNIRELQNQMERLIILSDGKQNISTKNIQLDFDIVSDSSLEILAEQNLSLEQIEKLYIHRILEKTRNNKSKAAQILGINRKTLLEKRKKYRLN